MVALSPLRRGRLLWPWLGLAVGHKTRARGTKASHRRRKSTSAFQESSSVLEGPRVAAAAAPAILSACWLPRA